MHITVRGHNIDLTEALKSYAQEKVQKIDKFFDNIQEATVELNFSHTSSKDRRQIAQITIWVAGAIMRAEEASEDMYASIDMAVDKIERQLIKYKDKMHDKHKKESHGEKSFLYKVAHAKEHKPRIVKTKSVLMKPMSVNEAALQMQLIHHDFFVFNNIDTEKVSVIYCRKDGDFGLLEPEG